MTVEPKEASTTVRELVKIIPIQDGKTAISVPTNP
jgi:hypothetical protein